MRRTARVNKEWTTGDDLTIERIQAEILMDIRDELRQLNRLLACENFLRIPSVLRRISYNTAKPKKKPKAKRAPHPLTGN